MNIYYNDQHEGIGKCLSDLFTSARENIIIVAPFIKKNTMEFLLEKVNTNVFVTCVTRWKPDEIVAGACDLEIWPLLKERSKSKLFLVPNLHAKYYRVDNTCIIGSANVTDSALAFHSKVNIELMIEIPMNDHLRIFENDLFTFTVEVDDYIYENFLKIVEEIKSNYNNLIMFKEPSHIDDYFVVQHKESRFWFPSLRYPQDLYKIYTNNTQELTRRTIQAGLNDLYYLDIPAGLRKENFKEYIGIMLLQQPLIKLIDEYAIEPRRFGAMRGYIKKLFFSQVIGINATIVWQTLMRWLLFFLPQRYGLSVLNYSEIFYRKH